MLDVLRLPIFLSSFGVTVMSSHHRVLLYDGTPRGIIVFIVHSGVARASLSSTFADDGEWAVCAF